MEHYPAVIVHGLSDAVAALAQERPVTLLSAPGAALNAGCGWWLALIEARARRYPDVSCIDILDCADGTGQALAALRLGLNRLVLWPEAPGRDTVVAIADARGGFVLAEPPASQPLAIRRADNGARLRSGAVNGDKRWAPRLGVA